jgi:FlaA1/EpsC-like NDP-sugar epimerase
MAKAKLHRLKPTHFILLSDLCLITLGLVLALLLNYRILHIMPFPSYDVLLGIITHAGVAFFLWVYFGISKRAIRHFYVGDYIKVLLLLFLLHLISYSLRFFGGRELFSIPEVWLISFVCSSFFLLASRLFFSYWYQYRVEKLSSQRKKHLLIYGAGILGLSLKKSIESNPDSEFKVVGFLDDEVTLIGKFIEGVEVFHPSNNVQQLIAALGVTDVIIASKSLRPVNKSNFLQQAIIFRIRELPSLEKWYNTNFNLQTVEDIDVVDLLNRDTIELVNPALNSELQDKVVLITGAAGSIGSEIVQTLSRYPLKKIICFDIAESPLFELEQKLKREASLHNVSIVLGDVRNFCDVEEVIKSVHPDIIFHAAAYKHVPLMEQYPASALSTNVIGSWNCALAAAKNNVSKFVLVSTDKAINPTSIMGCSKRIAEMVLQMLQEQFKTTQFITTRFGNVLGSNGSVVPLFKAQIKKGGPVTVTHPDMVRYFMTIPEAASLVVEACIMGRGGEVFIFDMGEPVRIKDLAYNMIRLAGLIPEKEIPIVYTGIRNGEKLYEDLFADQEKVGQTHHKKIMIGKIRKPDPEILKEFLVKVKSEQFRAVNAEHLKEELKKIVPNFQCDPLVAELVQ